MNKWIKNNKERWNAYKLDSYKTNEQQKLAHYGRVRIRKIIIGEIINSKFTTDVLGCKDRDEFITYLATTLPEGVALNYGKGAGQVCIDHIISIAKFDLTNPKEYLKCFNYKNLRYRLNKANWACKDRRHSKTSKTITNGLVSLPEALKSTIETYEQKSKRLAKVARNTQRFLKEVL